MDEASANQSATECSERMLAERRETKQKKRNGCRESPEIAKQGSTDRQQKGWCKASQKGRHQNDKKRRQRRTTSNQRKTGEEQTAATDASRALEENANGPIGKCVEKREQNQKEQTAAPDARRALGQYKEAAKYPQVRTTAGNGQVPEQDDE